jgi:hypothetical protein
MAQADSSVRNEPDLILASRDRKSTEPAYYRALSRLNRLVGSSWMDSTNNSQRSLDTCPGDRAVANPCLTESYPGAVS